MNQRDLTRIMHDLGVQVAPAKRKGWMDGPCPLAPWKHQSGMDRHPSFGVKIEEGGISAYHCYTCKAHGRISSLARALGHFRNRNHDEIAKQADFADLMNITHAPFEQKDMRDPLPEPIIEEMYDGMFLLVSASEAATTYLIQRGISPATALKLGLLYDPDPTENRILFPVRDREGNLYGWSGRAIDPRPVLPPHRPDPKVRDYEGLPKRHLILGEHLWRPGHPTFIVEGLFGYAHLMDIGADAYFNVGALLGSTMTEEKAERIKQWNEVTILALDNDQGGDAGIFGTLGPDGETRDTSLSAIKQLRDHVPLIVPEWPVWAEDGRHFGGDHRAGEQKIDPDQLTLEDCLAMGKAPVLGAPPVQPVAKEFY